MDDLDHDEITCAFCGVVTFREKCLECEGCGIWLCTGCWQDDEKMTLMYEEGDDVDEYGFCKNCVAQARKDGYHDCSDE